MANRKIRVGSRDSELAVIQAQLVIDAIQQYDNSLEVELVTMKTTGDKILDRTLDQIGGKGLFVKELDGALLRGDVDITVHSFKDLPMEEIPELPIVALGKREDPRDVLILPDGNVDEEQPIGCSSLRRRLQLSSLFPQRKTAPIRGNVQTRLRKLDNPTSEEPHFSALVLAAAGVKRLNLTSRISRYFTTNEILPAACQGIIAVQARAGEDTAYLSCFDDPDSHIIAAAERSFVRELDGGCSSPVAAYCTIDGNRFHLEGLYYDDTTKQTVRGSVEGSCGDAARFGAELARRLRDGAPGILRPRKGSVALVGAGPGAKGLLTLRGAELLQEAEVVVYDRLVSDDILAMIPEGAEKIDVGKESSNHRVPQEEINQILLDRGQKGFRVVRLKGGDPFVFGRGGEELELLKENGISFEVVPGITSAVAAACYAGIPVTHRDYCSSLHIITGHSRAGKELSIPFDSLAQLEGTLVFLMGVASLPQIVKGLLDAGMGSNTPAAIVENGTRETQRKVVATLATLPAEAERHGIHSPAVILVGKVCALSGQFDWFSSRPLFGKRILVTRPKDSEGTLSEKLATLGAEVISYPCIETRKLLKNTALTTAIQEISSYSWLLFSSKKGVEIFFEALGNQKLDARALADVKIGVVGSQTAQALAMHGIKADCIPEIYDGTHLGEAVVSCLHPSERVLICEALKSSGGLADELTKAGVEFSQVALYETIYIGDSTVRKELEENRVDCAVFASGSAVQGFVTSLPELNFTEVKAVCIGKQTAAAAHDCGMKVFVAKQATVDSLVEEVVNLMKK